MRQGDIYDIEAVIRSILPTCETNTTFERIKKHPLLIFRGGHGGNGGGAKNGKYEEWAQNYQMAQAFAEYCEEHGYPYVWLNPNAWQLPNWLREGIRFAKAMVLELRCPTIYFSIHHNNWRRSDANGFEVLFPEGSAYLRELADEICNAVTERIPLRKRGAKPRGNLYELKPYTFNGPALIIECGFLSNEHDMTILDNDANKYMIAEEVVSTILSRMSPTYGK